MAESADAEGLNPSDSKGSYGFKSRPGHAVTSEIAEFGQRVQSNKLGETPNADPAANLLEIGVVDAPELRLIRESEEPNSRDLSAQSGSTRRHRRRARRLCLRWWPDDRCGLRSGLVPRQRRSGLDRHVDRYSTFDRSPNEGPTPPLGIAGCATWARSSAPPRADAASFGASVMRWSGPFPVRPRPAQVCRFCSDIWCPTSG